MQESARLKSGLRGSATTCGVLVTALALLVIVGWHTHAAALIQGRPGLNPMAYNTALGFLFCGVGVVLAAADWGLAAASCGALIGLFGLLTIAQHGLGFSLRLDSILFQSYAGTNINQPTAVAPNTGLCFLLAGVSLLTAARRPCTRFCLLVKGACGSLMFALASTALFGYLADMPTAYGWRGLAEMAAPTATAFTIAGLGLLALAWKDGLTFSTAPPRWLPILTGVWVLMMALLLFQSLQAEENAKITPRGESPRNPRIGLPEMVLGAGAAMAILTGGLVGLFQTARRRGLELLHANGELERDIAERQRVEALLRTSEARFRAVAQTAHDGLITIDQGGCVVFVNPAGLAMFGYAADQILGQPLSRFIPERFRVAHETALAQAVTRGESRMAGKAIEVIGRRQDETEFPLELTLALWRTAEGVFFTGICRDITERKLAEEALRRSEASLRLAQRVGKTGGWELDLLTRKLGWSAETYRLFGQTEGVFAPSLEQFYAAIHPADRERVQAALDAALKGGPGFSVDHRIVLPDGTERSVHLQAEVVVDGASGSVNLAGVVQDITPRKQAERERERLVSELKEALASVKTLRGLLPICASCKKIRDDTGYWNRIESYIARHSDASFTHGLCPECTEKFLQDLEKL